MGRLWREAPWLTAGLALALLVAAVFAVRLVMGALFWADPRHQDMPIAPWMTPKFVVMSWDLPRDVVLDALEVEPNGRGPESLERIAREKGVPVAELIGDLEAAIVAYRAAEARGDHKRGGAPDRKDRDQRDKERRGDE